MGEEPGGNKSSDKCTCIRHYLACPGRYFFCKSGTGVRKAGDPGSNLPECPATTPFTHGFDQHMSRCSPVFTGKRGVPDLVPVCHPFRENVDNRIHLVKCPDHLKQFDIFCCILFPDSLLRSCDTYLLEQRQILCPVAADPAGSCDLPVWGD